MDKIDIPPLSKYFAVLGHPVKLEIFLHIISMVHTHQTKRISKQERLTENCIDGIARAMGIPDSTASKYINDLEAHRFIECKREGRQLYCVPTIETIKVLRDFINRTNLRISSHKYLSIVSR